MRSLFPIGSSMHQRLSLWRFIPSTADPGPVQHPGFDFSGATFNGDAPNPRTFMGGMSSS